MSGFQGSPNNTFKSYRVVRRGWFFVSLISCTISKQINPKLAQIQRVFYLIISSKSGEIEAPTRAATLAIPKTTPLTLVGNSSEQIIQSILMAPATPYIAMRRKMQFAVLFLTIKQAIPPPNRKAQQIQSDHLRPNRSATEPVENIASITAPYNMSPLTNKSPLRYLTPTQRPQQMKLLANQNQVMTTRGRIATLPDLKRSKQVSFLILTPSKSRVVVSFYPINILRSLRLQLILAISRYSAWASSYWLLATQQRGDSGTMKNKITKTNVRPMKKYIIYFHSLTQQKYKQILMLKRESTAWTIVVRGGLYLVSTNSQSKIQATQAVILAFTPKRNKQMQITQMKS